MNWESVKNRIGSLLAQKGLTVSFEWNGKTYHGVKTTLKRADVNTDAGLFGVYSFSLLCNSSFFPVCPVPRIDKFFINGVYYRLLSIERDSITATIRFHLGGEFE